MIRYDEVFINKRSVDVGGLRVRVKRECTPDQKVVQATARLLIKAASGLYDLRRERALRREMMRIARTLYREANPNKWKRPRMEGEN